MRDARGYTTPRFGHLTGHFATQLLGQVIHENNNLQNYCRLRNLSRPMLCHSDEHIVESCSSNFLFTGLTILQNMTIDGFFKYFFTSDGGVPAEIP